MVEAHEIMTKDVFTVTPETPISKAIQTLRVARITGLPVVDNDGNLVGIISEKDMMGLLLTEDNMDDSTVADFMTKNVKFFGPHDSAVAICESLLQSMFRRVPIVDNGKLVGIISRGDIISLIWKERWGTDGHEMHIE